MSFKMIISIVLVILFFIFLFQNLTNVTVNFLFFEISMPRSLLLIISLAIGLLIGIFLPIELKRPKKDKARTDS